MGFASKPRTANFELPALNSRALFVTLGANRAMSFNSRAPISSMNCSVKADTANGRSLIGVSMRVAETELPGR